MSSAEGGKTYSGLRTRQEKTSIWVVFSLFWFVVLKRLRLPLLFLFQGKQFDILEAWSLKSRRSELALCFVTLDRLPRHAKVHFADCEIGVIVVYHRVVRIK